MLTKQDDDELLECALVCLTLSIDYIVPRLVQHKHPLHYRRHISSMSWTQVYVGGLAKSVEPSDEYIEELLEDLFNLSSDGDAILWAGQGTTVVKRDDDGSCRGFAFLAFHSAEGASIVIDRINNTNTAGCGIASPDGVALHAELSNPKAKRPSKKKKEQNLPDMRIRRQRAAPIRKHPVITSSNGKRTNLGSKTK